MLLGREMLKQCRLVNKISNDSEGTLLCILAKHSISVILEGTDRRFWIIRDPLKDRTQHSEFHLKIWPGRELAPIIRAFKADLSGSFQITGVQGRFTAQEVCRKILDLFR